MKEERNENRGNKVGFIILGIISLFLLIINFIPVFIIDAGLESSFTGDTDPDAIIYVNKTNPDKNYVDNEDLYIGEFCEVYLYFNLGSLPKRTEQLYFFLEEDFSYNFYDFPVKDMEINVILVNSDWDASEINWNNKPKHERIINTVKISDITQDLFFEGYNFKRAVDLTTMLKENEPTEISFCLNITEKNEKLNSSVKLFLPGFIWNYEKVTLSYTTIISTLVVFSCFVGAIFFLRKDLFLCSNCEVKRILEDQFCRSCGTKFNDNVLIKGCDYQLILALLWLFIPIEVSILFGILTFTSLGFFGFFLGIFILLLDIFCLKQMRIKIKNYKKLKSNLKQT